MENKTASLHDFEEKGIVHVAYPADVRLAVEKAVASWKAFCALDEKTRLQFPYNANNGMGVGYELKKSPGATLDVKEDFHFTKSLRDWLFATAASINNETIAAFIADTDALIDVLRPFIIDFARKLETAFALQGFGDEIAASEDIWFVRFLHYFGEREIGDVTATAHADKDGFTPHLYESAPGFEYFDRDTDTPEEDRWHPVSFAPGETVIIPGMRLQYRSENRLKATYHRVVATMETAKEGRFSVVCFVHPKNTPAYDKSRMGRLQEFAPGFNYGIPWEEFKTLFK